MLSQFNTLDFGARGDGKTDDTEAVQKAIDAAAEVGGTVWVPAGEYAVSTLRLRSHVCLAGSATWEYRHCAGSVLRLRDPQARCLLDTSDIFGATLQGMSLDGGELGTGIHGVSYDLNGASPLRETTLKVDGCRISRFTGNGLHLVRAWVFIIRHSMLSHNQGDAMRVTGCDGLVHDCWLSGNGGAGFEGSGGVGGTNFTGNRIEWNRKGGIIILGASHHVIVGNHFDCCGGPGIFIGPDASGQPAVIFTITGNIINRCGAPQGRTLPEEERSQMLFRRVRGLVCTGNTMAVARGDQGKGEWSPDYGVVFEDLADSMIKDNVLHMGALKQLFVDRGGHGPNVVIKDNIGSLFRPGQDVLRTWI